MGGCARHAPFDESPGSPWVLLPQRVRQAFDLLAESGTPFANAAIGRPLLGVKCGCNHAFVVTLLDVQGSVAYIRGADGREGEVERALVRPVLRGESLGRWHRIASPACILWTHDASGKPFTALPPLAARWFGRWRRRLVARIDARRSPHWWSLFRTESAANDLARVAWADFGREPRALILAPGDRTVPLNTCYVAQCTDLTDALTLAAILNSAVAAAWLRVLAEPARGGYRRYLAWTIARLPLPHDWARARQLLAPIATRCENTPIAGAELTAAVIDAYQLAEHGRRRLAHLLEFARMIARRGSARRYARRLRGRGWARPPRSSWGTSSFAPTSATRWSAFAPYFATRVAHCWRMMLDWAKHIRRWQRRTMPRGC